MYNANDGLFDFRKGMPVTITYQNGDEWRQAFYVIIDCKNAFMENSVLSHSYFDHKLPEFIKEISQKHGEDRVRQVLATTINQAPWDGRYYREVKAWAVQVEPFPQFPGHEGEPRDYDEFCLNAHPVIINDIVRLVMKQEKELAHPKRKELER